MPFANLQPPSTLRDRDVGRPMKSSFVPSLGWKSLCLSLIWCRFGPMQLILTGPKACRCREKHGRAATLCKVEPHVSQGYPLRLCVGKPAAALCNPASLRPRAVCSLARTKNCLVHCALIGWARINVRACSFLTWWCDMPASPRLGQTTPETWVLRACDSYPAKGAALGGMCCCK